MRRAKKPVSIAVIAAAVASTVGLSGLDNANLEPLDLLQVIDQLLASRLGLLRPIAKTLAGALVDDHGCDG